MSLVNVKCPNCGASIQLDNERTEGFCSYCGSKIEVQEAINLIKIDKSGDLQNFLNLAKSAIEGNNGKEALDYANKALELDSSNGEAWFLKMQAVALTAVLGDLKCNEIVTTGKKAIQFFSDEKMRTEVYAFFLGKCLDDLKFCMSQLQDTKAIKDLYDANVAVNAFKATENTLASDSIADMILTQENSILNLRFSVPNDLIASDESLSQLTTEVAKQWVYYQNSINDRFNVYGSYMNPEALERYKQNLSLIKEGLPEDKKNSVDESSLSNESKGPCYIATSVYGSYDCPEVWTLRRFRDFKLAESVLGRAFIKLYYSTSPTLVKWFGKTLFFKKTFKPILDKLVYILQHKGVESTPYKDREW